MRCGPEGWRSRPDGSHVNSTPPPAARSKACCSSRAFMARVDFSLYLVTDRHQARGRSLQDAVSAALRARVRAIQLRRKVLPLRPLLPWSRELTASAQSSGARVLVNDRADACLAAGSDGTLLPVMGLRPAAARRVLGPGRLMGVSAHSADEAARAET